MSSLPADLLACPSCGGDLTELPDNLACASCGRSYRLENGVANLVLAPSTDAADAPPGLIGRALAAIVGIPFVYDLAQRLAGAEETFGRMRWVLDEAGGALVLDAGAGTGNLEATLPPSARYLWLDPDPQKLKGFRAKSGSPAILGDATSIPLKDSSVDWAISVGVSHHLDDEELGRMLDELRRVTRDRVVFVDAVASPALRSRLLWRYDRGRHPRPLEVLKRELTSRFDIATVEEFTILHRYLLVTAS